MVGLNLIEIRYRANNVTGEMIWRKREQGNNRHEFMVRFWCHRRVKWVSLYFMSSYRMFYHILVGVDWNGRIENFKVEDDESEYCNLVYFKDISIQFYQFIVVKIHKPSRIVDWHEENVTVVTTRNSFALQRVESRKPGHNEDIILNKKVIEVQRRGIEVFNPIESLEL